MAKEAESTNMKRRANQKVQVNPVPLLFPSVCHCAVQCHVRLCKHKVNSNSSSRNNQCCRPNHDTILCTQLIFFLFSFYVQFLSHKLTNAFQVANFFLTETEIKFVSLKAIMNFPLFLCNEQNVIQTKKNNNEWNISNGHHKRRNKTTIYYKINKKKIVSNQKSEISV